MTRDSILAALNDPNRAWVVLIIGVVLIYRECAGSGACLSRCPRGRGSCAGNLLAGSETAQHLGGTGGFRSNRIAGRAGFPATLLLAFDLDCSGFTDLGRPFSDDAKDRINSGAGRRFLSAESPDSYLERPF